MPSWSSRATATGLALGAFRVGAVGGHDLDGDRAPEALVAGGVDGPEATGAEARSEPVAAHRQAGLGDRRQLFRGRHPTSFHAREAPPSRCIRGCTGRNTPPRLISSLHVTRLRGERAAYQERSFLSFFDEDDEPRTQVRPRRPASAGGSRRPAVPDHQQVLIRRALLGAGILLVLILLVFIVRGCQNSAKQNALRDYNADVGALARSSDQEVSEPLFNLLRNPTQGDDLSSQINGFRGQADQQYDQAKSISTPDQMTPAQRSFLIDDGDAPGRPPVDRRQRAHRALERRRGRRPGDPAHRRRDVDVPRVRRDLPVARDADDRPRAAGRRHRQPAAPGLPVPARPPVARPDDGGRRARPAALERRRRHQRRRARARPARHPARLRDRRAT